MKDKAGNDVRFTILSKSKEGEYLMVKNAATEEKWWKQERYIKKENLFGSPETAYGCLNRRMEDVWFWDLYQTDAFYPVMITFYPDGSVSKAETFGAATLEDVFGTRKYRDVIFPDGRLNWKEPV